MRKNYFLSLFLLMTAFWNVEATDGSKSTNTTTRNLETSVAIPPNSPTGLNGGAVGGNGTRINLNWVDNTIDESEYEVAFSTNPSGYELKSTGVAYNGTGVYQLTGLQPLTTYYIAVRAIKPTDGTSPACNYTDPNTPTNGALGGKTVSCWSNVITVSTNPLLVPESPTGAFLTNVVQRSITVNWMDNSNTETSFQINRAIDGGAFTPLATVPSVPGTGNRTYVDNNIFPTGRYSYEIFAVNGTGFSTPARTSIVRTPPDPPIAPSGLAVQANGLGLNFIRLFWRNNASNAESFTIEYSVDNNSWTVAGTIPPNDPGFTVTNLLEGQFYFFRVRAANTGGVSGYSNTATATTLKRVAPNPSFNLRAKTISTTQIDLAWNLGVQDGVTNNRIAQEIYRSSISGTDGFIRIATIGDYEATYSDKTGSPKTKYWYKIFSVNLQGQSPFSNVEVATTLGPPFAPSDLVTALVNDALGNTVIKATWKDNSDDERGFALERSMDSTFATGVLRADFRF